MFNLLLFIILAWIVLILLIGCWRYRLFKSTWQEPCFSSLPFVIESDDWGPGPEDHLEGLRDLLNVLERHSDNRGRKAVLTANIILTIPDSDKITGSGYRKYYSKVLPDHFRDMTDFMRRAYEKVLFFPQLHGLAHYYPERILSLPNPENRKIREWISWSPWEWEALPHPLQAHYVDGTNLPSQPVPQSIQESYVKSAVELFKTSFGFASQSIVAPCYLWDDVTEEIWKKYRISFIQTAGYRCTGLDANGGYIQNPRIIRIGQMNRFGQVYLVRTVMFEPKDRTDAEKTCKQEIIRASRQGLPVVMSTHRYNYAGLEAPGQASIEALDRILEFAVKNYKDLMFINSVELGEMIRSGNGQQIDPVIKAARFLWRIWYRHKKIRMIGMGSLLVIPGLGMICLAKLYRMLKQN